MDVEFNLDGYRKLIRHLMNHYTFIDFEQCVAGEPDPFVILRHDIDYSLEKALVIAQVEACLLYTSPSPRDATLSRMPSSA